MSVTLQPGRTVTGGVYSQPEIDSTRSTLVMDARARNDRAGALRSTARSLGQDARDLHRNTWTAELEEATQHQARRGTLDLLNTLHEEGFAWRDIARMAGVSVPAVQKWRRGENATGANRNRLAQIVALIAKLKNDNFVTDPASWCEIPLSVEASVTPIDLIAEGKTEIVFELSGNHISPMEALDAFEPEWRGCFRDPSFETFKADDGQLSIRPRSTER